MPLLVLLKRTILPGETSLINPESVYSFIKCTYPDTNLTIEELEFSFEYLMFRDRFCEPEDRQRINTTQFMEFMIKPLSLDFNQMLDELINIPCPCFEEYPIT